MTKCKSNIERSKNLAMDDDHGDCEVSSCRYKSCRALQVLMVHTEEKNAYRDQDCAAVKIVGTL